MGIRNSRKDNIDLDGLNEVAQQSVEPTIQLSSISYNTLKYDLATTIGIGVKELMDMQENRFVANMKSVKVEHQERIVDNTNVIRRIMEQEQKQDKTRVSNPNKTSTADKKLDEVVKRLQSIEDKVDALKPNVHSFLPPAWPPVDGSLKKYIWKYIYYKVKSFWFDTYLKKFIRLCVWLMIIVGAFLLGFMIAENATLRKDNAKAVQIIQMMKADQIP
ncbi:MAG: hypothetical protein EOM41_06295 [Bacilli bacterium]|jgi:hypothetical protein|nr:hypothetical protein [Bacilli bacterium]